MKKILVIVVLFFGTMLVQGCATMSATATQHARTTLEPEVKFVAGPGISPDQFRKDHQESCAVAEQATAGLSDDEDSSDGMKEGVVAGIVTSIFTAALSRDFGLSVVAGGITGLTAGETTADSTHMPSRKEEFNKIYNSSMRAKGHSPAEIESPPPQNTVVGQQQ